ncbi:MAG TPA: Uma2 family endonuclease [Myxococcales bacterium]|jgi:Uma2 family endonuclease
MLELCFESTRTISQEAFRQFALKRPGRDPNHYELLNGRVLMNPPAAFPHGQVGARVVALLVRHGDQGGLGVALDSSQGFELPSGDTLEPDASFVSKERWNQATAKPAEGEFLKVVPDLVVEVLSASTASHDRGEKKAIYERNGVREYWLLDWRSRELTVFHLVDGKFDLGTVFTDADKARSEVLPGLEFAVRDVLP